MPQSDSDSNKGKVFGRLESLEKKLYARGEEASKSSEESLAGGQTRGAPPSNSVPLQWQEDERARTDPPRKRLFSLDFPLMKRILIVAVLFFLVSAGFAAYRFFGGTNSISTENVDVSIVGPTSTGAGETLSFDVVVQNQNNVPLEGVNLLIEYPSGTRTAADQSKELLRDSEYLGNVAVGEVVKRSKQAVLFGEADNLKDVIVSVEYRVKDSSATYFKEKNYDVVIATAPIRLKIDALKEVVSGKEIEISAEITSNSSSVVSGLLVRVDYPFGFSFLGSSPAPTYSNNIFALGDLGPSDRRVIRIRGTLSGQENEERNFQFSLGLRDKRDEKMIGTVFLSASQLVTIKRPFIGTALSLDGSAADTYATGAGQTVRGELSWSNNLPSRITDVEIQAKLSGDSLNRLAISANRGFYRSVDNVILWDKSTDGDFAVLEPGESGSVSFSFASIPASTLIYSALRGNEISIEISVKGRRFSDVNVPEEIISTLSRKVRISSELGLTGRSLYFTGPFTNQGPIPPKADKNTTYTIVWSVTNTLNSVSDTQVKAVLPGYVQWVGTVNPSGESVTYDGTSRQVLWNIGELKSSVGFTGPVREAAFQVSIVPSLSQRGTAPALVGPSVMTGTDRFSGVVLKDSSREITTQIVDAPAGQGNMSQVEP